MKKTYTKRQLENAYDRAGSYSGAAKRLGCDPKTFKRHYEMKVGNLPTTSHQSTQVKMTDFYNDEGFKDPGVKKLVDEYRSQKGDSKTTIKNIVFELVDKIDAAKMQVAYIKANIEKMETQLKNIVMEE